MPTPASLFHLAGRGLGVGPSPSLVIGEGLGARATLANGEHPGLDTTAGSEP